MTKNDINKPTISEATSRNWARLHSDGSGRLMSRANKQLSTKTILPIEYFSNKENVADIQRFVTFCKEQKYKVEDVLFSVGVELLKKAGIYEKSHVQKVLSSLSAQRLSFLSLKSLPSDEFDLLGLLYQCFLIEGEKNRKGSYYTPLEVARNMTKGLDFSKGQTFFDPCCGSGAFLLALDGASPEQVFGCDNDPIAVMIAKFNLLLKYPLQVFDPQIVCCDYLSPKNPEVSKNSKNPKAPSFIISNPPWGAVLFDEKNNPISTKESFSFFFEKAFNQLEDGGKIRFLLPESILNVKCHRNFRKFLLENTDIQSITKYPGTFSGVQTKYIDIECTRHFNRSETECSGVEKSSSNVITVKDFSTPFHSARNDDGHVSKDAFHLTNNLNFNLLSDSDLEKVQKILAKKKYTLKDSIWALGVITGDNKNKVQSKRGRGMEPIYTGKEIEAYTLKRPRKFIKYKRTDYQQVAKDEIYRADEKLVYKFISKNLVFAYDDSKSLFLNSANILIPRIPGMSIKTVLAFLNSELFKFLYKSLFGEIKILKGNLLELPFPAISPETDKKLTELVDEVLKGNNNALQLIDNEIDTVFGINHP
ncbi:MAG: N-6 DNA methylase [Bacteroidales bacterium]|nr:N-6 DNA methylase [Bacteroidales bacterium]